MNLKCQWCGEHRDDCACGADCPDDASSDNVSLTPFWDFCERMDVIELGEQLHQGLIHPLEYAKSVNELAKQANLSLPD